VSNNKPKLGKGLEALIPRNFLSSGKTITNIPIKEICPNKYQPRQYFDEKAIQSLAESIKTYGICQPILVRKKEDGYELIAGERRYKASLLAGKDTIPTIIKNVSDRDSIQLALIENLQREDLNCIEIAYGYEKLIQEFNLSHNDLAGIFGKSRSAITNTLRMLNLPESIKREIINGSLTEGHARSLLSLESEDLIYKILKKIAVNNLNVRETEALVTKKKQKKAVDKIFTKFVKNLASKFSTKIKISGKETRGRIEIYYKSKAEFERILSVLD
jgi:ParB family transcriptional regulator, chromosome partitioning protein